MLGAGHERGLRPGTENVAFIVGFGLACEIASRDLDGLAARVQRLRDELWARLVGAIPDLRLNGDPVRRLPNTLSVRFPGVSGNEVLAGAAVVAASTGSACHAGHESAPGVILAMGVSEAEALGTIRLTLGRDTTADDVLRAADALVESWRRTESMRR